MTATWTDIPDSSLEPGKPARSVDALALRDNPIAIAERATDAPIVQVPVIDTKTTGTAATWTWPDGVTAVIVTIIGGGGGTDSIAQNGGDSSITYNSITYTAGGGGGGVAAAVGAGGTATGGDISVPGMPGGASAGGSSGLAFGHGGTVNANGTGYGGGSGGNNGAGYNAGGGGGTVKKRVAKVVGLETITYTVGAGGNGNYDGAAGAVIFEY